MSFILDALKKAETERSRQSGPVLVEARLAHSRQRLPAWAWMIGGVLVANLLVLAWLLLRKPATATPAATAPVAAAPPAAGPVATPPMATAPVSPVPAVPPAPLPQPAAAAGIAVSATGASQIVNIPTMQELLATGVSLPPLQLNLHVYDEARTNRYVLLNSKRVREGDEVTSGMRVEQITPRGVVLDYNGRRFLMLAGS